MSDRAYARDGEATGIVGAAAKEALARGDTSFVAESVEMVTDQSGIKLVPGSEAHKKLSVAMLKAEVKLFDLLAQRHQGDVVDTPRSSGSRSMTGTLDEADVPFSSLWNSYKTEKKLLSKTASDFGTQVTRFVQVVGDLPVKEIRKAHIRAFKDAMLRMPARITNGQRSMTVPQLLEAIGEDAAIPRLTVQTVNDKALGAISAILGYAVLNGFRDDNPASGLKAIGQASHGPARLPYSLDDLNTIFQSPIFQAGERPTGGAGEAAKWLPLLGLFTGARLEELGRLEVTDVGIEDGVQFLFIHTGDNGRRVKNRSGRRRVPVHPELIRLGFLAYVDERRRLKDRSLFPDLKSKRSEITAAWSSWWGRYSGRIGIQDARKVFHSFRHTVKRSLRDAGVDKTLRDALQGHVSRDVSEKYGVDEEGSGVSMPTLNAAMAKLVFPGLMLDHLLPASTSVTALHPQTQPSRPR